jgi:hypothetical protein
VAGTSGTPLVKKLGIVDTDTVAVLSAPAGFSLDLPPGVTVRHRARGRSDVVLAFFTEVADLSRRIETLGAMTRPSGSLWIAWPKRTSSMATDMSDHLVRDVALPLDLVDNKVCAVDDDWTALRLVWRLRHRPGGGG